MTTGDTFAEIAEYIAVTRGTRTHAHNGHYCYRFNDGRGYLRILSTTDGGLSIYLGDRFVFQRRLTGVCEVYNGADDLLRAALDQEVAI